MWSLAEQKQIGTLLRQFRVSVFTFEGRNLEILNTKESKKKTRFPASFPEIDGHGHDLTWKHLSQFFMASLFTFMPFAYILTLSSGVRERESTRKGAEKKQFIVALGDRPENYLLHQLLPGHFSFTEVEILAAREKNCSRKALKWQENLCKRQNWNCSVEGFCEMLLEKI